MTETNSAVATLVADDEDDRVEGPEPQNAWFRPSECISQERSFAGRDDWVSSRRRWAGVLPL
jgi:hypothetical protein